MTHLVTDFSTHPLVPGCLLAASCAATPNPRLPVLDASALAAFNQQATADIVAWFQEADSLTPAQAGKILAVDADYLRVFNELCAQIPAVADVTGCSTDSIQRIARALFGAKLMSEYLEIVTPPQSSYEKTAEGTVDLLEELFDAFRRIVGGTWSVFFPRNEFSLVTDAAAQFWMACLYCHRPEEMMLSFVGLYRKEHRERLRALNQNYRADRTIHLRDAVTEYLDNAREKIAKLHEAVDGYAKEGLDRIFLEVTRILNKLEMPPLMMLYYEHLVRETCEAFAGLDGAISSKESRFSQYLLQQIATVAEGQLKSSGGGSISSRAETLEQVLSELQELVGIENVKEKVRQTANFAKIQQLRVAQGLQPIATTYHFVYTGNPGTGKTTVARLMGRIYRSLGILKKGHVVECDRSALVAEYIGQTAAKTNAVINSALDGILFIDEAYSLVKEHEDFGQEVLETLLKRMEDDRNRLIVIVAGYPEKMKKFIASNPGLESRFTRYIDFPDYTALELCRIFGLICRKNGLALSAELKEKIIHHFDFLHRQRGENFGNARLVRNCFESAITAQATRLAASSRVDATALGLLEASDLTSPAEAFYAEFQRSRRGYVISCPACGKMYRWEPDFAGGKARCDACGCDYDCEFGMVAA